MAVDYEALAAKLGGTITRPQAQQSPEQDGNVDYEALAARLGGTISRPETSAPEPQAERGFISDVVESITGRARTTPETQTLPEWTAMPELNQLSLSSFKTALGSLLTNPQETVQILQSNFPDVQVRQDAKGNYILRSSADQNEYAIPPGFSTGDIPRVLGGVLAFTPVGRATTIPRAALASGGVQTAIEASQAATGGEINPEEIGIATATGPAGQIIERAIPAVVGGARAIKQRVTGRSAPSAAASEVAPTAAAPTVQAATPEGIQGQQATGQMAEEAVAATGTPPPPSQQTTEDLGSLIRKASGGGFGSSSAKARLIDLAQVNADAKSAAERLGMDLPFDVFSDNPQVRAAVGLTRSEAGGEAEAAWVKTIRDSVGKADETIQKFDASFIEGRPATGVTSQRILDSLNATRLDLQNTAKPIYDRIESVVPKDSIVSTRNLSDTLSAVSKELGGEAGFTAKEKELLALTKDPNVTYARLMREKNLIGKAIEGKDSPYGNMVAGDLKRLYGALAEDQLENVANIGGEELRRELRGANLLTAKKKALENRIIGAFGKEADGSVATLMQSAIGSASKGNAAQFNKLMKVVPSELKKETVATALAAVSSAKRAGQEGAFGFAEFAKTYRGLRANPTVYKQVVDALGKDADPVLRDLYEISRRITDARAQVLTTGKANQALVESLAAKGIIGKIMGSGITQRAVTGATGLVPGAGVVAPDIIKFMTSFNSDGRRAAGRLFADEDFQKMAIEAATTGRVSDATIRRVAMTERFNKFADAIRLPRSTDKRIAYLQSAAQSGQQMQGDSQQ